MSYPTFSPRPTPQNESKSNESKSLVVTAYVLAAISTVLFPIILGPAAMITAAVGISREQQGAKQALLIAFLAMCGGFFLGASFSAGA